MIRIPPLPRPVTPRTDMPVCPACGGLECFCRPRFFAGQLLTDGDLNRLDGYIRGKNRLHNRYLQGSGAVAGLEVVCSPCEGVVTVRSGYALSPCGDDIVVCADEDVNVCDLIERCREPGPGDDCDPIRSRRQLAVDDGEEEWLLKICYEERPSRGVMALRSSGANCSRCGCRGRATSARCGCTCHGANVAPGGRTPGCTCAGKGSGTGCGCGVEPSAARAKPWSATSPDRCEPTLVCEGYRFEVCRKPSPYLRYPYPSITGAGLAPFALGDAPFTLGDAHANYWEGIRAAMPGVPDDKTIDNMQRWARQARGAIAGLLGDHGTHTCGLSDKLRDVPSPEPVEGIEEAAYARLAERAVTDYARVAVSAYTGRLCAMLLPPDPGPGDDCVVLATITVRRSDCRIVRVCNFDDRDIAITWQAVRYWLSAFGIERSIKALLARACCDDLPDREIPGIRFEAQDRRPVRVGAHRHPIDTLFAEAVTNSGSPFDPYLLMLDALGAVGPENQPLASDAELARPLEATLFGKVVAPLAERLGPDDAGPASTATEDMRDDLAEMRDALGQLRRQLDLQEEEIARLKADQ